MASELRQCRGRRCRNTLCRCRAVSLRVRHDGQIQFRAVAEVPEPSPAVRYPWPARARAGSSGRGMRAGDQPPASARPREVVGAGVHRVVQPVRRHPKASRTVA